MDNINIKQHDSENCTIADKTADSLIEENRKLKRNNKILIFCTIVTGLALFATAFILYKQIEKVELLLNVISSVKKHGADFEKQGFKMLEKYEVNVSK